MQENEIPFSQACENNKHPILEVIRKEFANTKHVLEIGSGTGQHAVHFAKHLPHLSWQTADQPEYHDSIKYYMNEYPSSNVIAPIAFKVPDNAIDKGIYDGFFSANTAHIMLKNEIKHLMQSISDILPVGGVFCQYGPFTKNGEFTSQSNLEFHQHLLESGMGGYRDITELQTWANKLSLMRVVDMPANNHILVWHKLT